MEECQLLYHTYKSQLCKGVLKSEQRAIDAAKIWWGIQAQLLGHCCTEEASRADELTDKETQAVCCYKVEQ